MRNEGALSLSAFISVFGSYCSVGRVNEAIMSFEVMDRYGVFWYFLLHCNEFVVSHEVNFGGFCTF